MTKQITHLSIDIKKPADLYSRTVAKIFVLIGSLCKKLIVLNFCDIFPTRQFESPLYHQLWENHIPSTLTKLKVNVTMLVDCLCLLDGALVCLSTLIITVGQIYYPFEVIDPTVST